ncbi:MAG: hypothetical protein OXD01_05015 [Gammaproteobacteria bacterium]|nr:hypothetical protein [Gammaproteobacteria bacterium]
MKKIKDELAEALEDAKRAMKIDRLTSLSPIDELEEFWRGKNKALIGEYMPPDIDNGKGFCAIQKGTDLITAVRMCEKGDYIHRKTWPNHEILINKFNTEIPLTVYDITANDWVIKKRGKR